MVFSPAFEGDVPDDHDPTDEQDAPLGRAGTAYVGSTAVYVAAIAETTRDYYDQDPANLAGFKTKAALMPSVLAHEILHGLFLRHDGNHDGGLMCANLAMSSKEPYGDRITEAQRATLRRVVFPMMDPGEFPNSCPQPH